MNFGKGVFMLKVNNSKKFVKRGSSLILASLLLASVFTNDISTVHALTIEDRLSTINDELISSNFSKTTKGILKAISNTTNNDRVLSLIDIALDEGDDREYFIAQGICTFAQEQEHLTYKEAYSQDQYNPYLYINYDVEDIRVFNNLNGRSLILPKQICLFTKIADFDSYIIYKVHDTNPSYIITDTEGNILSYSTGDTYEVFNFGARQVTSLKDFLEKNELSSEDSYSYLELFEGLTFDVSEKLSNYAYPSKTKRSNILVVDGTSSLTVSSLEHDDYYFIKYGYPYLFIDGRDVYKDVANENAKITVDEENTLRYYDGTTGTELFDLDMHFVDGGSSTSALVSLGEFAKDNGINIGFNVTDEFLIDLCNQFNKKGKSLEKQKD